MKKRSCLMILALCLLLTACGPAGQSEPAPAGPDEAAASAPEETAPEVETLLGIEMTDELSERERGFIKDLDMLRKEFEYRHPNPYSRCSKEEVQWRLEQLAGKVGELSDSDFFFETASIVAAMDDGVHTQVYAPKYIYDRIFPLSVTCFGDKTYLQAYIGDYEQFAPFLLREIVAVNGVDMAYIRRKAESVLSPYNSWFTKESFDEFALCPAFYDWVGCDCREGYTFQFLNENQEVVDVEVPVIPLEERNQLLADGVVTWPENWEDIFYRVGGNWAAYVEGDNGGCIYVSWMDLMSHDPENYQGTFMKEACELAAAHPDCRKLAIDLRMNPGGYISRLKYVKESLEQLKSSMEQIYVLAGGCSTSAAPRIAALIKGEMDAVIVGEPTGEFTSFYVKRFIEGTSYQLPDVYLPHAQLTVMIATSWSGFDEDVKAYDLEWNVFQPEEYRDEDGRLYPWESTILPDVYVYQDIEDIRQGKDSVIEWVLAQ